MRNVRYALSYAVNSAKRNDAEIIILHVMEVMDTNTYNLMAAHIGQEIVAKKEGEREDHARDRIKTG